MASQDAVIVLDEVIPPGDPWIVGKDLFRTAAL